ncbi:hypothetical protein FQN55_000225 [Onygenales sp. PD_40]|nr:hypothetical protein FQN55_000225 [Onygenales sp. PD_40]KAK2792201.1 hypothetical protein FQN51_001860 [Onygenales sp. PD_10]
MTSQADLRISNLFSFNNHVALVTGGASGLGEMAAQGLVQNGARVIIASRKEVELKKCTDRLNKLGPGKCEYIVADLKDKAGCDYLAAEVKKRTDRLTVLVNNTGVTWGAPYDDFPESGWDKIMALNVKSIFYLTVGLTSLLKVGANADMPSRIINIASMAGISTLDPTSSDQGGLAAPGSGTFSYGPSKAAVIHLSRQLSSKLAPQNVMVNCVCPGVFPSRMSNFGIEKFADTLLQGQPTGRLGKPEDFAGLILFLCSYASAHMTGNVIELDGGSTRSGMKGRPRQKKL